MLLSDLSIKRPVLATVLSLIIILVGLISYDRLAVREYPKIDEPVVNVATNYPGASAEIIESQVTQPLEESLAGIEGIELMTSTSRSESSQITDQIRPQTAIPTKSPTMCATGSRGCAAVSRTRSTSR